MADRQTDPKVVDTGIPPATPSGQAGGEKPLDLTGTTHKVKADGKIIDVPYEELLRGYSATAHLTKESQKMADERKKWQEEKAKLDEELAKHKGGGDLVEQFIARLKPAEKDPLMDSQSWQELLSSDPTQALDKLRERATTPQADKEMRAQLTALQQELQKEREARETLVAELTTERKARAVTEVERRVIAAVPEYESDDYVQFRTRAWANSEKPVAELGGRIGNEVDPVEIAKVARDLRNKDIEDRISARQKATEERKAAMASANSVQSMPLPDLPDEISKAYDDALQRGDKKALIKATQAKAAWMAEQAADSQLAARSG